MWYLVSGDFHLILEVFSKLTPNVVNKSLRIFKVLLEKSFKVRSYNRKIAFLTAFVLDQSKVDCITKKWGDKCGMVYFNDI